LFKAFYLFIYLFIFYGTEILSSGLHTCKAGLYRSSQASSPFCTGYFGDEAFKGLKAFKDGNYSNCGLTDVLTF
jgi:hypothetical protein